MAEKDRELEAIHTVIDALDPLDQIERSRVLEYVLKRLEMATVRAPVSKSEVTDSPASALPKSSRIVDIRSLKDEKQPRSASEMVAIVAYYLSELASPEERSETINAATVRRYFKTAGFRLPTVLRNTLPNAAGAGYLDNVSRGEYRLNPVGYNLVVHALPRGSAATSPPAKKRRKRNQASKKRKRNKKAAKRNRRR